MKRKKMGTLLSILLAMVAVVVLATGCGQSAKSSDEASTTQTEEEKRGLNLDTPVGTVTFPAQWTEDVKVKEKTEKNVYTASFYGEAAGKDVLLFEFVVGGEAEDYQLGTVPDASGKAQNVGLNIKEIEAEDAWSDEESEQINTLQSSVNDLIEQFYAMDGFKESETNS